MKWKNALVKAAIVLLPSYAVAAVSSQLDEDDDVGDGSLDTSVEAA